MDTIRQAMLALLSTQRHNWEHGVCMQAFFEAGKDDVVTALALAAVQRTLPDGRIAALGNPDAVTDPCACGEALQHAAALTGDPMLLAGLDGLKSWVLSRAPRNQDGILYHVASRPEFWVDSIYMLPPFLASIGAYNEAMRNFAGYYQALYDPDTHLMSHIYNDETKERTHDVHWATGNGWTLCGIVRLAGLLPDTYGVEQRYLRSVFMDLLEHVLACMEPDGTFHDILDDPETFKEYCGSMMTAYSMFRASSLGWIEKDTLSPARRILQTVRQIAEKHNGFIFPVCGAPDFTTPGYSPEAQAFYLMLLLEAEKTE